MAIKDGTEFCTSFNNMSQHSKDKLPTPGLKRKLKTHTIETKFQAIADVERGIESKAVIAKKYEIPPTPCQRGLRMPKRSKTPMSEHLRIPEEENVD